VYLKLNAEGDTIVFRQTLELYSYSLIQNMSYSTLIKEAQLS